MLDAGIWCLSRLGARNLFSGPINLVVSPSIAARWVEALLRLPHTPALLEAVVHIAQQTGDVARDLPPATLELVRRACEASPTPPVFSAIWLGNRISPPPAASLAKNCRPVCFGGAMQ